ncbi:MAG: hypothetical protein A3C55_00345 [Gammaproteobacteria bacterium RIFCSPHIGHO2_02_FULL_42_13]|nr:MAG: hypothetical protein A3C55_00345 [Gammaproteobacteria bacterium RIFCSPHIGHO2_02_FULL_42_13]OGT68645.1 MAG: hypothetical protein A3H43_00750 [Gammaproteobacteria bacterium RIFCSPLOWO2_02_FULL_42_9]
MRRFVLILFGAIIILPFTAWAVWQVANPVRSDSSSNSIVNPALGKSDYPSNYTMRPAFNVHLSNASLQINIEKFAAAHQWNVIWRTTQQFPVLNRSPISGSTFPITLNRLLEHYPLYAQYDMKTKTVWIFPKKK